MDKIKVISNNIRKRNRNYGTGSGIASKCLMCHHIFSKEETKYWETCNICNKCKETLIREMK